MESRGLSARKADENNKIIVILGPTSSGKSGVAIRLAKKFNGEIISADSRQVYRGLDIGAGKEPEDKLKVKSQKLKVQIKNQKFNIFWSSGIAHYGIDIVNPKTEYNIAKFKKYSDKVIKNILERGKVPIICGGTGFWIKSVVDDVTYPEVKPNPELRNKLRNKSKEKLFSILEKIDPIRAKSIDKNNPIRLIRAIEICKQLGSVPKNENDTNKYKALQIGISHNKEKLQKRIGIRLEQRFKEGMIEEVKKLHLKDKVSWKRLESFGLGYKIISEYLRKDFYPIKSPRSETDKAVFNREIFERVYQSEKDYAKRQMTWFSKDKRIIWLEKYKDIEKITKNFLKK